MLITRQLGNVLIIGSRHSANTLRLREFLGRNGHPYTYVDLDADTGSQALLDRFNISVAEVPIVICNGNAVLRNPSAGEVADCLGLNHNVDRTLLRDLIIVGAGPAGLAAAVYAASEGTSAAVGREQRAGRASGSELQNRELSRVSDWHLWAGACIKCGHAGTKSWREAGGRTCYHATRLRTTAL